MIAAGLGVSIVPISIANQVRVAGVKYLKIVGDAPIAPIALGIRPDEQSVTVRNFFTLAVTKRVKGYNPKPGL